MRIFYGKFGVPSGTCCRPPGFCRGSVQKYLAKLGEKVIDKAVLSRHLHPRREAGADDAVGRIVLSVAGDVKFRKSDNAFLSVSDPTEQRRRQTASPPTRSGNVSTTGLRFSVPKFSPRERSSMKLRGFYAVNRIELRARL